MNGTISLQMPHNEFAGNRSFIVPVDGTGLGEHAVSHAQQLVLALGGVMDVLNVVDSGPQGPNSSRERYEEAKHYVTELIERVDKDVPVDGHILVGAPAEQLLQFSRRKPGSMVVLETRGRGRLGRLFLGSVAHRVMLRSSRPVMLVRQSTPTPRSGLRRVLVPLDGTALSESALSVVSNLARTDSRVVLVHVVGVGRSEIHTVDANAPRSVPNNELVPDPSAEAMCEAQQYLDAIASRLRMEGVRTSWEVRVGRPELEIARLAETTEMDLIAMATYHKDPFHRWVFGSVADEVVRHATVPVIVISPGREEAHLSGDLWNSNQ